MNLLANKMALFFSALPERLRQRRMLVWLLFVLITTVMVAGLPRVRTDGSTLSYFSKHDPVRKAYDQFRAAFGGDEDLYIVYEAKDKDVFSETSLKALQGIQEELLNYRLHIKSDQKSPLDHIDDVTTLLNVSYLESANDALISRDFIGSALSQNESRRERLRQLALKEKNISDIYFSSDSKFGGIVIETDFNAVPLSASPKKGEAIDEEEIIDLSGEFASDAAEQGMDIAAGVPARFKKNVMADYVPFMDAIRDIIHKPEYAKHLKFHPVGEPAFEDFVFVMILGEMGKIILGMFVLVILITGLLYRSISAMLWSSLCVAFSLIWTMGTIGWSGVIMPDLIIIVVFFVISVCIAGIIHILSGYLFFREQGRSHPDALGSVFKKSGLACTLASLTTGIGFSAMLFVPIVSMQRIGGATAVGIIYAFIMAIVVLPLMLDIWRPVPRKLKKRVQGQSVELHLFQRLLRRVEAVGINNATITLILFFVVTIGFATGINKIRLESSNIEILRPDTSIRKAFDIADDHMVGTDCLEIVVDTGRVNGMKDPRVLRLIEKLQNTLERDFSDTVTKTYSIADVTKDSFQALNNDSPVAYIIPKDPDVLSQTLFLFDNADPDDRRELVTDDYRIGRISVFSESLGTMSGVNLMEAVEQFSSENLGTLQTDYPDAKMTMTGIVALRMKMYDFVSRSQMIGFGITLCVISVVLLLALGSVKIGLLAMIPNLFPIFMVAGLMGYLKIPLDIHTLLVMPIVLGIAVDDTIHFLTHFQLERQQGADTFRAVIYTYREVGQAILFTSIILSIGFLMFLGSKNMGFVYFGILNAAAITFAVIADLFLLPAVLAKHYPTKYKQTTGPMKMAPKTSTL